MESMHKIYFDSNIIAENGVYWLGLDQSVADLNRMGSELKDGALVKLYVPDDCEIEAVLIFDPAEGCWYGKAV